MSLFHTALKAGASLALLALASTPASAAAVFLDGGGSSLLAPYIAQVYCARIGGFGSTGLCNNPATSSDRVRLYNSTSQQNIASTSSVATSPDPTNIVQFTVQLSSANTPSATDFTQTTVTAYIDTITVQ